jgi:hypothetical protein
MKTWFVICCVLVLLLVGCAVKTQSGANVKPGSSLVLNVREFGAPHDGKTSATRQIQAAIDAAAAQGGGTVLVPAGQYVTGTLWMKSNVTLHIDAGATLLGSQDKAEFPEWTSQWEGPNVPKDYRRYAPLFAGENLENVALVGRGTVDARGEMWWAMQTAQKGKEMMRPRTLRLVKLDYLDAAGLLASAGNRVVLRRSMPKIWQILLWDRVGVPVSRVIDPLLGGRVGKSVLAVWRKEA